jgi:hypothetical protein
VQALSHQGGKAFVWVVQSDDTLQDRTVQVGLQTTTDAEIVSGLNEGEQVVVSDLASLKVGQKVRPQTVAVPEYKGDAQ